MIAELFLANVPFDASEREIRDFVRESGALVSRVRMITDFGTEKFRGFCFVDVDVQGGPEALEECRRLLFGKELKGRPIHVEESRNPRRSRREA
jgi:RNA recognition motif-containing protein